MRESLIKSLLQERDIFLEEWMTMTYNEYNYYLRTLSDEELIELSEDD
jgi:hypothetical protein